MLNQTNSNIYMLKSLLSQTGISNCNFQYFQNLKIQFLIYIDSMELICE